MSCLNGMFLHIKDFSRFYRKSKLDGFLWMGTFLCVLLTSADIGLGIGIALTILVMAYRNYDVTINTSNCDAQCIYGVCDNVENGEEKIGTLAKKMKALELSGTISFANYERIIETCKGEQSARYVSMKILAACINIPPPRVRLDP